MICLQPGTYLPQVTTKTFQYRLKTILPPAYFLGTTGAAMMANKCLLWQTQVTM